MPNLSLRDSVMILFLLLCLGPGPHAQESRKDTYKTIRHVLAPGAQRVLDRAHGSIEDSPHLLPFITERIQQ
jgi:hypothetical protein